MADQMHPSQDITTELYTAAKAQVRTRLDQIWDAAAKKELERLKSYHLYGPKFTEFKNAAPCGDAVSNEQGERAFFSALSDATVDMKDLKVNVFGDVAIATFNGDFRGSMGGKSVAARQQSSMVFVRHEAEWKVVHEHFSPLGSPTNE